MGYTRSKLYSHREYSQRQAYKGPTEVPRPTLDLDLASGNIDSRITYSGGANATKTDADGVIGYAPHNLWLQSEDFGTGWNESAATISTNTVANPVNGAVTADTLHEDDTGATSHYVRDANTLLAAEVYTASVYVKAINRDWVFLQLQTTVFAATTNVSYDLSTGTVGVVGSGATGGTITDVGDGWYRLTITATTATAGSEFFAIYLAEGDNDVTFDGLDQDSIYIFGAQVNIGATALTYTPTTTAAVWTPRFDHTYDGTNWNAKGLLVEEARTNLCLQSEDISTTWTNVRTTDSTNDVVAPDGTTTGDTIIEDGTEGNTHYIRQQLAASIITDDVTVTFSVYTKAANRTWVRLALTNKAGASPSAFFDIGNGVVGAKSSTASSITAVGNGWFRLSMTHDIDAGATDPLTFYIFAAEADSDEVFDGLSQDSIHVWGAMVEAGAFPTSYIKTTTAAVARTTDKAEMSDVSWLNQSAGTFFAEISRQVLSAGLSTTSILTVHDDSSADNLRLRISSTDTGSFATNTSSGNSASSLTANTIVAGVTSKIAAGYIQDNVVAALDGTLDATTDTSADIPVNDTLVGMNIGTRIGGDTDPLNGHIARITYWPRRLSDFDLINLTT